MVQKIRMVRNECDFTNLTLAEFERGFYTTKPTTYNNYMHALFLLKLVMLMVTDRKLLSKVV
jgi:hypothetical protein